jgi:hypothetical protein
VRNGVKWIADSLWELLSPRKPRVPAARGGRQSQVATIRRKPRVERGKPDSGVQNRYAAVVEEMKRTYGVRIRKWRKNSSGVAYEIRYRNGDVVKLIESPYPRGPVSCAIFLHEIGHHAIGLGVHRPRCLEEYKVWMWALSEMRRRRFNVTASVEKRVHDSMKYAVAKARRRGMKSIPAELAAYL